MMHRLKLLKEFDSLAIPEYLQPLRLFTTQEIVPYPFANQSQVLEQHPCIGRGECGGAEVRTHFLELLHSRVVEHNLRVVAGKIYTAPASLIEN